MWCRGCRCCYPTRWLEELEEASASAQPEACGTVEMMENPRGRSGLPHHHRTTATASYIGDQGEVGAVRDCFLDKRVYFFFS